MTAVTVGRETLARTLSADVREDATGQLRDDRSEPRGGLRRGDVSPDYFRHYAGTALARDAELPRASV